MKHSRIILGTAALVAVAAGSSACGDQSTADSPTATKTVTVTETAEPAPAPEEEKAAPVVKAKPKPKPKAVKYRMPDLRGENLQFAQDTIQSVTGNPFFVTDSVDARGLNRFQVLDSGWTVCGSTPKPSSTFTDRTMVTFSVVKDTESCR